MSIDRTALKLVPPPGGAAGGRIATTDRIVDAIVEAIVDRRLMPGTKLPEQSIADIFNVSRTIVRQAFNQLARDRLITLEPARGAFVARPSIEEARQVFEVRAMVETAAVRELCQRITPQQIVQLKAHLRDETRAVDRTDVPVRTRLLGDFHVLVARLLGNDVLTRLLADLTSQSSLIALMYQSAHAAGHSLEEHVAIVDAVERRDARLAVRLMRQHLSSVERGLRLEPGTTDLRSALTGNPG